MLKTVALGLVWLLPSATFATPLLVKGGYQVILSTSPTTSQPLEFSEAAISASASLTAAFDRPPPPPITDISFLQISEDFHSGALPHEQQVVEAPEPPSILLLLSGLGALALLFCSAWPLRRSSAHHGQ